MVAIDLIVEHIRTKLQQPELRRIYPNLELIPSNFQIQGMHTIIRDRKTSKEGKHVCQRAAGGLVSTCAGMRRELMAKGMQHMGIGSSSWAMQ